VSGADWRGIHASTLVVDGLDCSPPTEAYAIRLRAAGVRCLHLTIEDQDSRGGGWPYETVAAMLEAPGSSFRLCRTVAEIEQTARDNRIALVLGQQAADPVGVEPGSLARYHERGLRITGITYNASNRYGGGCLEPGVGLSVDGRALVDEVGHLGMLLDVGGHTGERASLEAIERSGGRPVICSHTGLAAVNPNRRNTSDRVCEAIARSGGVVGVLALSDFLVRHAAHAADPVTPQAPLARLLDHLDHLRRLVGPEHVGLGPDFMEGLDPSEPGAYPGRRFEPDMIGAGDRPTFVAGFESIDRLPNVTAGLLDRGWPVDDVRAALGENWLRVYRAAWGA
jgi:membrane dipeptidase